MAAARFLLHRGLPGWSGRSGLAPMDTRARPASQGVSNIEEYFTVAISVVILEVAGRNLD